MNHAIQEIPLSHIVASKTNPRKTFAPADLQELADDIKANGVQQAILVRPLPNGLPLGEGGLLEIVFGERRYRASHLAGLATIPGRVRELNDQAALEIQMVENLQRVDLDPVEEAEGYQAMLNFASDDGKPIYTVEMLSEKLKKDKSHIYRRLKLQYLPPAARQALLDGMLPISTVTLIARIPGEEMRKTATQEILKPRYQDEPLSRDKAQKFINENFMRELKGAPFDQSDPTLIPKMGACGPCPFRTGNAPEIYGDVKRGDICTNPSCYGQKSEVTWSRLTANAEKENKRVLSEEATKKVFPYDSEMAYSSPYVDLKKQPTPDLLAPGTKNPPSWKKLLAKSPCAVEIVLARDSQGKVHELVTRAQAIEAVRQSTASGGQVDIMAPENKSNHDDARKAQIKAEKERAKLEQRIARAVVQRVVEAVENEEGFSVAPYSAPLLETALHHAGYEGCYWVEKRREIEGDTKRDPRDTVAKYAESLQEHQRNALIVELFVARDVRSLGYECSVLQPWLGKLDLKIIEIAAAVKKEQQAAGKKKKAKTTPDAKPDTSQKPASVAAPTDNPDFPLAWMTRKEEIVAFDWTEAGVAESPDVVRFLGPWENQIKLVAVVGVARGEQGWHFGWETGGVKPSWKMTVPCSAKSQACGSREEAVKEALEQVLATKKLKSSPAKILAHVEQLIASIPVGEKV